VSRTARPAPSPRARHRVLSHGRGRTAPAARLEKMLDEQPNVVGRLTRWRPVAATYIFGSTNPSAKPPTMPTSKQRTPAILARSLVSDGSSGASTWGLLGGLLRPEAVRPARRNSSCTIEWAIKDTAAVIRANAWTGDRHVSNGTVGGPSWRRLPLRATPLASDARFRVIFHNAFRSAHCVDRRVVVAARCV